MRHCGSMAMAAFTALALVSGCAGRGARGASPEYSDGGRPFGPPLPPAGGATGGATPMVGGSAPQALWAPRPDRSVIPVRAVIVSDDDGTRQAKTSSAQMAAWIEFANRSFAPAGIELRYDGQLLALRSTIVNRATTMADMQGVDAALRPLMARFAGELLVLTRFGPSRAPSREAFSGLILDYVVMGGFDTMSHCGHPHLDAFAHELGHFFGLSHTFSAPARSLREAEALVRSGGGQATALDGDGLADTPPDPAIRATECGREPFAVVAGHRFELPRRNLMSYYDERDSLTPQQIELARWVLRERLVRGMRAPKNDPAWPLEAEQMRLAGPSQCAVQQMAGYRDGHWSGNAQRMCSGPVRLSFVARRRGPYRLMLYATRAPDYAPVDVFVDGTLVGAYEGRAPLVMPTGPIPLGELRLSDGEHVLELRPSTRVRAPAHGSIGVDALQLVELP